MSTDTKQNYKLTARCDVTELLAESESAQSHLVVELRHCGVRKQPGHVVHVLARAHIDSNAFPDFRLSPFNRSLCRGELSMGVNGSVVTLSLDGSESACP